MEAWKTLSGGSSSSTSKDDEGTEARKKGDGKLSEPEGGPMGLVGSLTETYGGFGESSKSPCLCTSTDGSLSWSS